MSLTKQQVYKYFDRAYYLEQNPDLKAYVLSNPVFDVFEHYINAGKNEGRIATEAPSVDNQKSGSFEVYGNCPKGSVTVGCFKGSDSNYVKETYIINGDITYMYESSPQNQFCKIICVSSGAYFDLHTSGNLMNMNCCDQ